MRVEIGWQNDKLSGNHFFNCRQSIHLTGLRSEIYYNTFTNTKTNLFSSKGIWVDGWNGISAFKNTFNGQETCILLQDVNGSSFMTSKLGKNVYNNYKAGIGFVGDNSGMSFDNETFNFGEVGIAYGLYDIAGLNLHRIQIQGSLVTSCRNYFSNSVDDIKSPDLDLGNTDPFWYYYPDSLSQLYSGFRPLCSVNNIDCNNKANFHEIASIGGWTYSL